MAAGLVLGVWPSPPAQAAQATFIAERTISRQPVDVVHTPNAKLAIVRGHVPGPAPGDGITVFDTASGLKLTLASCHPNAGLGGAVNPSDFVQATNSRAILVGGRDTDATLGEDKTYIDVLAFDMSGPTPVVTCLAHHEVGSTSLYLQAGYVGDVAITPDESFAIVNSQNWIHVIELSSGNLVSNPPGGFNVGALPEGPCSPGFQSDSVATTNSSAIVTTKRFPAFFSPSAWVYILDLVAPSGPVIALEHQLSDPDDQTSFDPHDVAITPNGSLAVVSASELVGVYDLNQHSFKARTPPGFSHFRLFSEIVDSVEVTNTRAVVIGNEVSGIPPNLTRLWIIEVYSLVPPFPPPDLLLPLRKYIGNDYIGVTYPNYQVDVPHDLAIDSAGEQAVIRTQYFDLVVADLQTPDLQDLHIFHQAYGTFNGGPTFVSDSVQIAPPFYVHVPPGGGSGLRHYAITLGANYTQTFPPRPFQAKIDLINIGLNPPTLDVLTVTDPSAFPWIVPTDIQPGIGRDFVVRCDAQPNDPGSSSGRDFLYFGLSPPTELARIGASGTVFAVDSLEVRRTEAVSVSEEPTPAGYVHFVRLN